MINQQKIIIMTQLATMDKNNINKSRKITEYYIEDYIYKKNLQTRILVGIFGGICIIGHVVYKIEEGANIPTTVNEMVWTYVVPYAIFIIGLLCIYSIISSISATKEYVLAQKKVEEYDQLIKQLEKHDHVWQKGEKVNDIESKPY